jgi:hypothetical protein
LNDITTINIETFKLDKIQNAAIAASAGVNVTKDGTIGKFAKNLIDKTENGLGENAENDAALSFSNLWNGIKDASGAATKAIALQPWAADGASKVAQSYNGIVRNPHVSSIFNGVDLKTFQLNFRVSVGSAKEADNLNKAVLLIRNRMHPEAIANSLVLKYPDVATMKFVGMSEMVPRIKEAFIQQLNITNFPQGPAVYRDGTPVEVLIDITLTEIDARMRDDEDNVIDDSFLIPSSAQSASDNGFSEGNI